MKKDSGIILGIIPARGGSKGVKDKNIRTVLGKPLIAYSINCGLSCPSIDRLIVSTDSDKIAKVARSFGAEVPFIRPSELARDDTPMMSVLEHALNRCESLYKMPVNGVVLLDATSPLRTVEDVENCIAIFKNDDYDAVISAVTARRNPYFNMIALQNGYIRPVIDHGRPINRRQDCPPVYDLNNSIWIFSRRAILEKKRIPEKSIMYLMDSKYWVDIDGEIDFKILELMMREKNV
jgi:CMP-N-acetylneuraminic acid synthetase